MSAYLVGASFVCAQNSALPPEQVSRMLGERQILPYRRAFASAPMPLAELLPLLEAHLRAAAYAAGWTEGDLCGAPVFLGSTVYVMADREYRAARENVEPSYNLSDIAAHLRARLRNPQIYSLATSCTASAHGIAQAAALIANGFAERALVLGFETFNRMTFEHFHALNLASPAPGAPGIVLGESIACVALARQGRADSPMIRHIAAHTDHGNLTENSADALRALLRKLLAHTPREALQSVKIHGAGGHGDTMEQTVLDELLPDIPRICHKPRTGHTLGASGALETALTLHQPPPTGQHLHYYLGFGGSNIGWILQCP